MNNSKFAPAESITHAHILTVINTIVNQEDDFRNSNNIRILDAGCGNGKLIKYLNSNLHLLHPETDFIIHGYDVIDHGVQSDGFLSQTICMLSEADNTIDWGSRIHAIGKDDVWRFVEQKFDFIISNQVLEHIYNKNLFFRNVSDNLKNDGYSIHLAPLKHVIYEGHIYLPWAHRIRNYSALLGYIKLMSRIGFGKFRRHHKVLGCTLQNYSERHADYMYFWTSYANESETLDVARNNQLRADFRYSLEFYTSKLRQIFGVSPKYLYRFRECGFWDAIFIKILRYISSVTLILKKSNKY